ARSTTAGTPTLPRRLRFPAAARRRRRGRAGAGRLVDEVAGKRRRGSCHARCATGHRTTSAPAAPEEAPQGSPCLNTLYLYPGRTVRASALNPSRSDHSLPEAAATSPAVRAYIGIGSNLDAP